MKVLVVDDEQTNRIILQSMLEKDAHEVCLAENGEQALSVFEQEQPELILMDVMMPVVDGYQATRIIKEKTRDRFVPIIFLTAMTDDEALVKCIESGGDDFLTKPYSRAVLRAKISAFVRIRQLYETVINQNRQLEEFQRQNLREQELSEEIFARLMRRGELDLTAIKTIRRSAGTFNGDITLVSRQPSGHIYILIGDFTGHGLAAAIGALPTSQIFYAMCAKGFSIDEIAQEINKHLKAHLPVGMFMAAGLIQMEPAKGRATIWNGGLPDILIYSAEQQTITKRITSGHVPLGIVDSDNIKSGLERVDIKIGDKIIGFSDGLIEASNSSKEFFGQTRLEDIILRVAREGDQDIVDVLLNEMHDFRGDLPLEDDTTLLEFTYTSEIAQQQSLATAFESIGKEWKFRLELDAKSLVYHEPVSMIMNILRELDRIDPAKEEIFLVLTELFNNAFDYGVLGLDSSLKNSGEGFLKYYEERQQRLDTLQEGSIVVEVSNSLEGMDRNRLQLKITDSGTGFDYSGLKKIGDKDISFHGRGIALTRSICESVTFNEQGNSVEIVYLWK